MATLNAKLFSGLTKQGNQPRGEPVIKVLTIIISHASFEILLFFLVVQIFLGWSLNDFKPL